jgi:hypothetical protein
LKKVFKIKEINITNRADKRTALVKVQDMHLALKRFKKLLNEKFAVKENEQIKPIKTFEKFEVNLYKLKTELKQTKENDYILNIAYPYKDEIIENLLLKYKI